MSDSIEISGNVPAAPADVLAAYLDAASHAEMTGGDATSDPRVGGRMTAWDGYIEGTFLEIEPDRIVQTWRSSDFPEGAPDSRVEIRFTPAMSGTRVTFVHTEIPDGQGGTYKDGWKDYYLVPMRDFFGG